MVICHVTTPMTYLAPLLQFTQHDNTATLKLPYHPPEVHNRVLQRPLCGYVGTTVLVALEIEVRGYLNYKHILHVMF